MKPFVYIFFCTLLFFSIPVDADDGHSVAILLDVSKSVSPTEFERIKGKIREIITQQTPSLRIALYIFGNNLQQISFDQLTSLEATQSNTIFYDALYDVMRDLEKEKSGKKSIVIFSDGKDTKSATILNDIVSSAHEQKIVIHCAGIGKANQRLLERLAKLTGGQYFAAENAALVMDVRKTIEAQSQPAGETESQIETNESVTSKTVAPPSVSQRSTTPPAPTAENEAVPYRWIGAIAGLLLVSVVFVYRLRHLHREKRICPTCGKSLEPSQLVCSDCPGQTQIQPRPDIPTPPPESVPAAVPHTLQPSNETQELLSKTYFLDEAPALVVTKGQNIGERYRLSKDQPVSIGRSRLNEIRPDDPSISAQHCRIIPENGEYTIYDLGSTNGTVVNNINVNMAVLEEGDTIRVGSTTLLFTLAAS